MHVAPGKLFLHCSFFRCLWKRSTFGIGKCACLLSQVLISSLLFDDSFEYFAISTGSTRNSDGTRILLIDHCLFCFVVGSIIPFFL